MLNIILQILIVFENFDIKLRFCIIVEESLGFDRLNNISLFIPKPKGY